MSIKPVYLHELAVELKDSDKLFDLDIEITEKGAESELGVTVRCNSVNCSRICHTGHCASVFDLGVEITEKVEPEMELRTTVRCNTVGCGNGTRGCHL